MLLIFNFTNQTESLKKDKRKNNHVHTCSLYRSGYVFPKARPLEPIYATTLDNFRVVRNSRNQYNKWMFNGKTAINRTESVF